MIRAYTERRLSITECAHRFTASYETIRAILKQHGIPIRSGHDLHSASKDQVAPSLPRTPSSTATV
ncbi:MAG: hypothetical protein JO345_01920 [Streptosporangiaceae bacterium]|nr:hypothetical protein [Streptosporangiaceae bacterium]